MKRKINKTLSGLFVLNALLTGCVARQATTHHEVHPHKMPDGSTNLIQTVYGAYEMEYTPIGNLCNASAFSIIGAGYFACQQSKKDYNSTTNGIPFISPLYNGTSGFIKGSKDGFIEGCQYGYNLKYKEGNSIGHIAKDYIDDKIEFIKKSITDPYGR